MDKPKNFENDLADYGVVSIDSQCGEPRSWGFLITNPIEPDRWEELKTYGELLCIYPSWFLVMKRLTTAEAIEKYGEISNIERGPRGGFRTITFGETTFNDKRLLPKEGEYDEHIQ